jgi:hypothetical protein
LIPLLRLFRSHGPAPNILPLRFFPGSYPLQPRMRCFLQSGLTLDGCWQISRTWKRKCLAILKTRCSDTATNNLVNLTFLHLSVHHRTTQPVPLLSIQVQWQARCSEYVLQAESKSRNNDDSLLLMALQAIKTQILILTSGYTGCAKLHICPHKGKTEGRSCKSGLHIFLSFLFLCSISFPKFTISLVARRFTPYFFYVYVAYSPFLSSRSCDATQTSPLLAVFWRIQSIFKKGSYRICHDRLVRAQLGRNAGCKLRRN